jgi:hypothetical protein
MDTFGRNYITYFHTPTIFHSLRNHVILYHFHYNYILTTWKMFTVRTTPIDHNPFCCHNSIIKVFFYFFFNKIIEVLIKYHLYLFYGFEVCVEKEWRWETIEFNFSYITCIMKIDKLKNVKCHKLYFIYLLLTMYML